MSDDHRSTFQSVTLPFIIFTLVWGSTWIVIRGQLGSVPPQWSVTYRFIIAAVAMFVIALAKRDNLNIGRRGFLAAAFLGFTQFCVNFNAVYLAERHITSGVVATVFALLLIPSSLLGWAFLGHKPTQRFFWSSTVAVAGISLLFAHELNDHPADASQITVGIGLTLVGMLGASIANVVQARPEIRHYPLLGLLAWSMAAGALIDAVIAFAMTGPPTFDPRPAYWAGLLYLALAASVLTSASIIPWSVASARPRRPIRASSCRSSRWDFRPPWRDITGPRRPLPARFWRSAEWSARSAETVRLCRRRTPPKAAAYG